MILQSPRPHIDWIKVSQVCTVLYQDILCLLSISPIRYDLTCPLIDTVVVIPKEPLIDGHISIETINFRTQNCPTVNVINKVLLIHISYPKALLWHNSSMYITWLRALLLLLECCSMEKQESCRYSNVLFYNNNDAETWMITISNGAWTTNKNVLWCRRICELHHEFLHSSHVHVDVHVG